MRFFTFNGILILMEFSFNEIWIYSWFCSSGSIVELCVGVLQFKVFIGSFLCKEAVRWKKEELQPKTGEVSGHRNASKMFVRKYCEFLLLQAQVLNERRQGNATGQKQTGYFVGFVFCLSKHWVWPWESLGRCLDQVVAEGVLKL